MMVLAVGLSQYNIALMHLVLHAMYKAGLFLAAGSVLHAMGDQQDFRRYGGLVQILPLTYTVMLIASLSLAALPWLSGYYSKDVRSLGFFIVSQERLNHFSYMITTSELEIKESFILNIASPIFLLIFYLLFDLLIFDISFFLLLTCCFLIFIFILILILILLMDKINWVVSSMIKAILLKVYYSLSFRIGNNYIVKKIIGFPINLNLWFIGRENTTGYVKNILMNKSERSKEDVRIKKLKTGLPNVSIYYGNRIIVVPVSVFKSIYDTNNIVWRGRVIVNHLFQFKYYSTGCINKNKKIIDKLNSLQKRIKNEPHLIIDRKLYSLICNMDLLLLAFQNLKSISYGYISTLYYINSIEFKNIPLNQFKSLIDELKLEKFQFIGYNLKKKSSLKKNEKYSSNLLSLNDKLVLESIRILLSTIYEPLFLNFSHGYRLNKNCHTALHYFNNHFQDCNWFIDGFILNCIENINFHFLVNLIEMKIKDRKFTRLIWKSLRAGFFHFDENKADIIGSLQGSLISPIMINIYLHELDKFIFNFYINNNSYSDTSISSIFTNKNFYLMNNINYINKYNNCLSYVRYGDRWVIGIKGSYKEAEEVRNKISEFLSTLNLKLNEEKTNIVSVYDKGILFLGVIIKKIKYKNLKKFKNLSLLKNNNDKLYFLAPLYLILIKLREAGFIKNNKSIPKFLFLPLDYNRIIHLYSTIVFGYINYYSFVDNLGKLIRTLLFILKGSCAKLLAAKYSLKTQSRFYKKYGKFSLFNYNEYVHKYKFKFRYKYEKSNIKNLKNKNKFNFHSNNLSLITTLFLKK